MIRLKKPITKSINGNTTGTVLLTVGSDPLPNGDNAVTVALLGLDISVDTAAVVQIKSADTVLYHKEFSAAAVDRVTNVQRFGHPTHGMKIIITGSTGDIRIVADIGYEYNGGAKISA